MHDRSSTLADASTRPSRGPSAAPRAGPGASPAARSGRGRTRAAWLPWVFSGIVHAILTVACVFVVWHVAPPAEGPGAQAVVSFDMPGPGSMVLAPAPASPSLSAPGSIAVVGPSEASAPQSALAGERAAAAPAAGPPAWSQTDPLASAGDESVQQRRVPDVRFAGLGAANAQDIVYVVDASGSMVGTFPVVLEYLRRSTTRLARSQRFQVVFFGPEEYLTVPHPGDVQSGVRTTRLIRATPDNVAHALSWASSIIPEGRSNPVRALQTALNLHPSAVFVLSSSITGLGQWEVDKESLLRQIDELNPADASGRRQVVIKTLQFIDDDPGGVLRAIGEAHGGEGGHRFISRQEALTR